MVKYPIVSKKGILTAKSVRKYVQRYRDLEFYLETPVLFCFVVRQDEICDRNLHIRAYKTGK